MPGTRPTIATIARDLGVSRASVSYALSGKPGVSDATRARVRAHAAEIGWSPHAGARALRRGRSENIGFVIAREPRQLSLEPFYSAVTAGIETAIAQHGFGLLIKVVPDVDHELAAYRTWSEDRRVDGVVIADVRTDDPRPALLEQIGLPTVVLGSAPESSSPAQVVISDALDAATLVEHAADRGYTSILQITGPSDFLHEGRRRAAVAERCQPLGLPHRVLESDYSLEGGAAALTRALPDLLEVPDAHDRVAVIASSDLIALGAQRAARAAGIDVPSALGVLSWDDSLIMQIAVPDITALHRAPFDLGGEAGELMTGLLDGSVDAGTQVVLGRSSLHVRGSTTPTD